MRPSTASQSASSPLATPSCFKFQQKRLRLHINQYEKKSLGTASSTSALLIHMNLFFQCAKVGNLGTMLAGLMSGWGAHIRRDVGRSGLPWVPAISVEDFKTIKATNSWFPFCDHHGWAVLNHGSDKTLVSPQIFFACLYSKRLVKLLLRFNNTYVSFKFAWFCFLLFSKACILHGS